MSDTKVTLTGTGIPHATPGRAGAGALVRYKKTSLQFDAGRGTTLRLAEAGSPPLYLGALFLTHYHSDHVVDVADVAMTRWVQQQTKKTGPLTIVTPDGPCRRFVERMFDAYSDDIEVRRHHTGSGEPGILIKSFAPTSEPQRVWQSEDGDVTVDAIAVHHEPVEAAVAYRVNTPDGAVVISGDTRVCDEVFELARGAQVIVHEACRKVAMSAAIKGTAFENIFDYHSDTVALGAMAQKYAVPHMVLTHLIPSPHTPEEEQAFDDDLRAGGYTGTVSVGRDLFSVAIGD
jgi:ribonuclease Z